MSNHFSAANLRFPGDDTRLDLTDVFAFRSADDLPKIDVPILVIHGDADQVLPLDKTAGRLPGLIKDVHLVVVEGGPHAIPWTHAAQVNTALLGFLRN